MKKLLYLLPLLLLTGCLWRGNTTRNTDKEAGAVAKTTAVSTKIDTTQDKLLEAKVARTQVGATAVFGTGLALGRVTNTEPALVLAKDLNAQAGLALPQPTGEQIKEMTSLVENLLSTNAHLRAEGESLKSDFADRLIKSDKEIATLTKKLDSLNGEFDSRLSKERAVGVALAEKANKWDKANTLLGSFQLLGKQILIAILVIGIVGIVVVIGLNALSVIPTTAPIAAPFALIANKLAGLTIAGVTKLAPKLGAAGSSVIHEAAGLVPVVYKSTLETLTAGIENAKAQFPDEWEKLKPFISKATDQIHKDIIEESK